MRENKEIYLYDKQNLFSIHFRVNETYILSYT